MKLCDFIFPSSKIKIIVLPHLYLRSFLFFFYFVEHLQDNVPAWEKRFCYVIGSVPWRKLVNAKKFISCHSNILDWDDSAVEDAFQNAKKRFWANMNGFACDISPPDPDIYIDEVDWNSVIDPELMKELDQAYFAPADEEGDGRLWGKNKKTRNWFSAPPDLSNVNQIDGVNPWECNNGEIGGISQSKENGWNLWNDHIHSSKDVDNNNGSWDCNATRGDRNVKDESWGDHGKTSWGNSNCNKRNREYNKDAWGDHRKTSWDNSDFDKRNSDSNENPWERGSRNYISQKGDCWGSSWDKQEWGWNWQEWNHPWVRSSDQHGRAQKDRGWKDCGGDSARCGKQWDLYNNQNNEFGRRSSYGRESWNGDFQKREGFHHSESGYKSSRFRGDENQTRDCWRRENNKKRVSFA